MFNNPKMILPFFSIMFALLSSQVYAMNDADTDCVLPQRDDVCEIASDSEKFNLVINYPVGHVCQLKITSDNELPGQMQAFAKQIQLNIDDSFSGKILVENFISTNIAARSGVGENFYT